MSAFESGHSAACFQLSASRLQGGATRIPPLFIICLLVSTSTRLFLTRADRPVTWALLRGQQRFRFQVLANYGCKCAVCAITHPSLMKAAHIRGKAHKGSDDWRNGLPLCSTHHDAFDAHLFRIHPDTLGIEMMPGVSPISIGVIAKSLTPIHQHPHPEALSWRFTQTNRLWAAQDNLIAAPRQ